MSLTLRGVMQAPVTPFKDDFSLDVPTLEKVAEFHVGTGATGITWPYHKSESLNMTTVERKLGAEAVVRTVAGRVPVAIHVSALAVEDAMELARHARKIGADAIVAITPYFWKPSPEAIFDYFVRLGTSIDMPLIAYNSPGYLSGVGIDAALTRRLIERLPNLRSGRRGRRCPPPPASGRLTSARSSRNSGSCKRNPTAGEGNTVMSDD